LGNIWLSPAHPKYKKIKKLWILKNEAYLDFYKATRRDNNKNIRNKRVATSSWTA
jgi:hypothetical protein